MNPYQTFASAFAHLITDGKSLPLGDIPPHSHQVKLPSNAPVALIFSPHPDDECIIGGLALRLLREAKMRVINVAVTHGSNKERQGPRLLELKNACDWIGFDLEQTASNGLDKINAKTRTSDPAHWNVAVKIIAASLAKNKPRAIFF